MSCNNRIKPMRRSAFRSVQHSGAASALLLMAHPHRWALSREYMRKTIIRRLKHAPMSGRQSQRFAAVLRNDSERRQKTHDT